MSFFSRLPLGWLYQNALHLKLFTRAVARTIVREVGRSYMLAICLLDGTNKWLNLVVRSYTYSWILGKKLGYLGRYLFSCMKVSAKEVAGGIYVSSSSWQDPPQGPPHFLTDYYS